MFNRPGVVLLEMYISEFYLLYRPAAFHALTPLSAWVSDRASGLYKNTAPSIFKGFLKPGTNWRQIWIQRSRHCWKSTVAETSNKSATKSTVADTVNFVADKVNFVADKVNFVADTVNFVADKVNFVADKVNFVADKVNFVADTVNFVADTVNFVADKVNFVAIMYGSLESTGRQLNLY